MSEENEIIDPVDNENPAPSVDADAILAENAAMKAKLDELLGETKRAKAAAREADERARKEAEEKARKAGDFEQLHKSSEQARQALEEELNNLRSGIANEKRDNAAMKIAADLAEGANAEILSEFISRRLKYTDDGLKVLDDAGQLTVSSIDELAQDFRNNSRFASLLKGNQSTGGGATGGTKQGASAKEMSRSDFDKLPPAKQMEFIKGGGRTFD
jgi:alanyl-tRNA synthetase